jgi:predicted transcriptional regulator
MAKKLVAFNIDIDDLAKLDAYATNLERDRTYVLNQAVKMYIADAEREAREDEEAIAQIRRGEGRPVGEFFAELRSELRSRGKSRKAS